MLHEKLCVKKLDWHCIPHLLIEEYKEARVNWCQRTLDRFNEGNSKKVYSIVNDNENKSKRLFGCSKAKKTR